MGAETINLLLTTSLVIITGFVNKFGYTLCQRAHFFRGITNKLVHLV